jgi:ribosomal protein L11 methyltransferase
LGRYPALDLRYSPGKTAADLEELVYAALDDLEATAIQEHESADGWRVFFCTLPQRDRAATTLAEDLSSRLTSIEPIDVDDENWAQRSQESLKSIRVGRVVVAPPWEAHRLLGTGGRGPGTGDREPGAGDRGPEDLAKHLRAGSTLRAWKPAPCPRRPTPIVIVIVPSMGFGTGHHPTTRLCLELLQMIPLAGLRVIDVGTGSGVLALAAWKLGARSVLGVDYDADAIANARENASLNGATASLEIREADLASFQAEPADVVTANLTAAVIQKHADALQRLVRLGGNLILSGFAPEQVSDVAQAFNRSISHELVDRGWTAISLAMESAAKS